MRTSQTNDFLEEVTGFDGSWKRGQGHSNEHFKSRPVVHLRALRRFTADHNIYPILNLLEKVTTITQNEKKDNVIKVHVYLVKR